MMKTRQVSTLAGVAMLVLAAWAAAAETRVLIITGQTVHDTKSTTPFIEQMYGNSKKFKLVATVEDVTKINADTFAKCDVIVSNWTCHPIMTGGPWTPEGKKALADAISSGKGMVQFHAATAACNDWPEFQQISGLSWKWEYTNHTSYHTFKVVVNDPSHPITKGLPDFWITDELYQKMFKFTPTDFKTHMQAFSESQFSGTSQWEPVLITTQLGKGRGVYCVLGHDVRVMQNVAWQTIMLRATEWAATGRATIAVPKIWPKTAAMAAAVGVDADAAMKAASQYTFGNAYQPLFDVEQLVMASTARTDKAAAADRLALADKLAAAIASCKTPEAKSFFCKQLAVIGTESQVPAVAPLLADEKTATMARFALERISGPASAKALREAAKTLQGGLKIGAINSVGVKADAEAVADFKALIEDADAGVATAAVSALGKIGTMQAADALRSARSSAAGPLKSAITEAYLVCAERLATAGNKDATTGVYRLLYGPSEPASVRAAALHGLVAVDPRQQTLLIKEALESKLPELHEMAAYIVRTMPKAGDTRAIAELSSRLAPSVQAIMLTALAQRGDKAATYIARKSVTADDERVRIAAIAALARLGDDSDVYALTLQAQAGSEAERAAVAATLASMPSAKTDAAITQAMVNGSEQVKLICLSALIARNASIADNLALKAKASSPDDIDKDGAAGGDDAGNDGDPATYWDEADNQKLYVYKLTWSQPVSVSAINIRGHAFESFCPKDFDIVCDGKVVKAVKDAVYDRTNVAALFSFPSTACTSLELRITGWYGGSPAIRELEVYDLANAGR